ncbi:putative lipoprotein [Sphingobium herbicidovorans NBRC 16415]|jgi:cholesterol transport system auxiliary component|uniref:Lipoprotein n=1 Tax=Sphingobium herbicidovorans (strain ATCC 700291 / DSM 11019 / CCUG 56400 / KCTC 2939 / LMG 18315 / NBRC 16415 / MH) TaxID=1219045 RepID=A0A086P5B7_SPHHM|nr:ABC-type transport auxiliary lipoprotein family protein [Sphingobium herbicidovorans]KFG88585.1 putative lipoprotein [Sphingobium herbicidovorans NBRC 16415]
MFHKKPAAIPLALALAAALSGCVSFGGKPPEKLLSLDAAQKVAPGTLRSVSAGSTITVADPEAPKLLDTVRVPVRTSPTSIAYVTKVQWADTPRHLFQKLLSETIAATSNRIVLDPGQYSADAGQRLMGELIEFGLDEASNSAVVTYDAILAGPGGTAISRQRFTASVPVGAKIEAGNVGAPLNQAANKVAADVAAWLASTGR